MKWLKYQIIAPIHGLIDELLRQPVVIYCGILLILKFNLFSILLFITSIIFAIVFEMIVYFRHDRDSLIACLEFLEKNNGCSYKETSINEVIRLYDDEREVLQIMRPREKIQEIGRYIYVDPESERTGKVPNTFTAFPLRYTESFIVSTIPPHEFGVLQKYAFFHELGHLSYVHIRAKTIYMQAIVKATVLLFLISLFLSHSPYLLALLYLVVLLWLYNHWGLKEYFKKLKVAELIADAFAFSRLYNKEDWPLIEKVASKAYNNWESAKDFAKEWISDPIDVESSPLYKLFPKSFIKNHISNRIVNYSSLNEKFFTPKPLINLTLLFVIILTAYFSVDVAKIDLITVAILLIPVSLLYLIRIALYRNIVRNRIRESMKT